MPMIYRSYCVMALCDWELCEPAVFANEVDGTYSAKIERQNAGMGNFVHNLLLFETALVLYTPLMSSLT